MGRLWIRMPDGTWDTVSWDQSGPYGSGVLKLKQPDGSWAVHVNAAAGGITPLNLRYSGSWDTVLYMQAQDDLSPILAPGNLVTDSHTTTDNELYPQRATLWESFTYESFHDPIGGSTHEAGFTTRPVWAPFGWGVNLNAEFRASSSKINRGVTEKGNLYKSSNYMWRWIVFDIDLVRQVVQGEPTGGYIEFRVLTLNSTRAGTGEASGNAYLGVLPTVPGISYAPITNARSAVWIGHEVAAIDGTPQTLGSTIATFPLVNMVKSQVFGELDSPYDFDRSYVYRYELGEAALTQNALAFSLHVDEIPEPEPSYDPALGGHEWSAYAWTAHLALTGRRF